MCPSSAVNVRVFNFPQKQPGEIAGLFIRDLTFRENRDFVKFHEEHPWDRARNRPIHLLSGIIVNPV